jgi:hypothetical protein
MVQPLKTRVQWDFVANDAGELRNIRDSLLHASVQKSLDEQFQMTLLLKRLANTPLLQYPLKVRHIGDESVPDFQVQCGPKSIAVEVAKVTNQNLETARRVQWKRSQGPGARSMNLTLPVHRFWGTGKMKRREVVETAFLHPQESFGPTLQESEQMWLESVRAELDDKTQKCYGSESDENWLLLEDRLGSANWQLEGRRDAVETLLVSYWKTGRFSRVFIQGKPSWCLMFTRQSSKLLQ